MNLWWILFEICLRFGWDLFEICLRLVETIQDSISWWVPRPRSASFGKIDSVASKKEVYLPGKKVIQNLIIRDYKLRQNTSLLHYNVFTLTASNNRLWLRPRAIDTLSTRRRRKQRQTSTLEHGLFIFYTISYTNTQPSKLTQNQLP